MKALKLVFFILTNLFISIAFPQTQNDYASIILGSWVTPESLLSDEIESTSISSYFKYEFVSDNTMFYGSNEFERGKRSVYAVAGDVLEMFGAIYTIQSYTDGELKLVTFPKLSKKPFEVTLVRKEKYDSLWRLSKPIEVDEMTKPVFDGDFHLYDYLFSTSITPAEFEKKSSLIAYEPHPVPPKDDIRIKITLVVDSIGKAIVIDMIAPEINKRLFEKIKRKMENTSGYWLPAMHKGVNKTVTLNLIFVKHGASSLKFVSSAWNLYHRALSSFEKEDYLSAMKFISNAIILNSNKFQFYLLRASCNIQMNEPDKFCNDVFRAHSLNPFVKLTNEISVNGEIVQIKCGVD